MENITTAEVMDKLDMFQSRFGKIDQFGWWDLERISEYAGTQFTSTEFKEECQIRGVRLTLAAPEHQEMNGQVEVTWRTLCTIAHSLMVHARVPEIYIHFSLIYTTDNIFPVLPISAIVDKLDMFQSRFGKIDQFGWWDLERIQQMQVRSLPRQSLKRNVKFAEFV